MTLKGKVFFTLLWPLLCVVLVLYLLALFALKKEVATAEKNLSTQIFQQEAHERKEIAKLFEYEVKSAEGSLSTWLTQLKEQPNLLLAKRPAETLLTLQFLTKADAIELSEGGFLYRYFPKKALSHPLEKVVPIKAGYFVEVQNKLYYALPLKEGPHLLFEWECLSKEQKLHLETIETQKSGTANKDQLIPLLLPYVVDGYKVGDEKLFPVGIATIDDSKGEAWLLDGFFTLSKSLGGETYILHEGSLFSMRREKIDGREVGLGFSLSDPLKKFAQSLDLTLFITLEKGPTVGFQKTGELSDVKELSGAELFSEPLHSEMTLHFLYDRAQHEKPLLSSMVLYTRLFRALAYGLFLAAVLFVCVALCLFWYLLRRLMHPLDVLADLQNKAAEGKYEEEAIAKMAKRGDEIGRLAVSFSGIVQSIKERENIRAILNKVVSKEVADEILKQPVHLGGEDRVVTMLFADIRNFTHITSHFPPQKVVSLLNVFMTKMTRIIEGEGGIIDKYVGDEIMALFGAPAAHPDHAIRALAASKLMIETLKKWNVEREKEREAPIEIGIGIHTGLVVAGNMGTEDRLNYTVIGADVSLAARLCQAAVPGQILLSEHTLCEPNVRESFEVKELSPIRVKGFDDEVKIYEVIGFKWEMG